jgi:serine/threonine-protein kinase RsbW
MASKIPISYSIATESVPSAVVGLCKRVLSALEANGFSEEDIFAVHLTLEEAFINAVKHGNKMDPDKEIKIEYSVCPDKVEIRMTDEGNGFNPNAVPDPRCGENLYKPDGRGLLLIRSYMDVVEYNKRGNSVYMIKYKGKPPLTENQSPTKV